MNRLLFSLLVGSAVVLGAPAQNEPAQIYERMHKIELGQSERKRIVQQEFDLGRSDVSDFVLQRMNQVGNKGDDGIREAMEIDPAKTFEWMLDNYRKLGPAGRGRLISGLGVGGDDYREFYLLLTMMLDDQTLDVNPRAQAIWPGPRPYLHRRICDHAYNRLILRIGYDSGLVPPNLPKVLAGDDPFEYRDKTIREFKSWWIDAMGVIANSKPALSANRPAIQQKLGNLLQKDKSK